MRAIVRMVLAGALALAGCGKSNSADDGGPSAQTVAKGGVASGRITRPDGRPIGIAGVSYDLNVSGISNAGEKVNYSPKPDANGTWSTKLVSGIYHKPSCTARVPFNGEMYTYELVPTADLGDTDAEKGIAADFVWNATGPHTYNGDKPDPANATNWFGGSCSLLWDRNPQDAAGKYLNILTPDGAKLVFTAVAKGKAIDGSDPKPIVWERSFYKLLASVTPSGLNDMAPTEGGWTISGKEILPDKTEFPLGFRRTTETKYQPSIDVKIGAVTISSTHPADGETLWVLGRH